MRKILSILFILFYFGLSAQIGKTYLPTVAWKTQIDSVVLVGQSQLGIDTFIVKVKPMDYNDPGAIDRIIGNYLKDYIGHVYTIIDSSSTTVTVVDEFGMGVSPQQGREGVVYRSVGRSKAPFLAPIWMNRLDESARDFTDMFEKDVLWKHGETIPFDSLKLTTSISNVEHSDGLMYYDYTKQVPVFYNTETGMDIGMELWLRVKNKTGSILTRGSVVYINGEEDGVPTIDLADNSDIVKVRAVGVLKNNLEDGKIGVVVNFGKVERVNTSNQQAGDLLYVGVNGGWTKEKPMFLKYQYQLGYVTSSNNSNGEIVVRIVDKVYSYKDLLDKPNIKDSVLAYTSEGSKYEYRDTVEVFYSDYSQSNFNLKNVSSGEYAVSQNGIVIPTFNYNVLSDWLVVNTPTLKNDRIQINYRYIVSKQEEQNEKTDTVEVFFASNFQTNFSLKEETEKAYLVSQNGIILPPTSYSVEFQELIINSGVLKNDIIQVNYKFIK